MSDGRGSAAGAAGSGRYGPRGAALRPAQQSPGDALARRSKRHSALAAARGMNGHRADAGGQGTGLRVVEGRLPSGAEPGQRAFDSAAARHEHVAA